MLLEEELCLRSEEPRTKSPKPGLRSVLPSQGHAVSSRSSLDRRTVSAQLYGLLWLVRG